MEGSLRRGASLLSAALLVGAAVWLPGAALGRAPVSGPTAVGAASTPSLSMTLSVKPGIAVSGTETTWTGVLSPTGTVTNLHLNMAGFDYYQGGALACTPVEFCVVDSQTHNPYWTFPTLSAKTTITTTWIPPAGLGHDPPPMHWDAQINILSDGVSCSGACPPVARLYGPTPKVTITATSSGTVMPGSVLHVAVVATSNAWPMGEATVTVSLPAGLTAPTNLTPGSATVYAAPNLGAYDSITWSGPYTMTFDTTVTAPLGTNLKLTATAAAQANWNGTANGSRTVHVGPVPTATPRPTATPKGSTGPGRTPAASTAPSSSEAAPTEMTASSSAPSAAPATEPGPSAESSASGDGSTSPSGSANGAPAASPDPGGLTATSDAGPAVAVAGVVIAAAAIVGLLAVGLRRRRPI